MSQRDSNVAPSIHAVVTTPSHAKPEEGLTVGSPGRSSVRRRIVRALLILVALLLVAGFLAQRKISSLEADALLLADTGQTTIRLLKAVGLALGSGSATELQGLYSTGFQATERSFWKELPSGEQDGVALASWLPEPDSVGVGPNEVLAAFERSIGEVEELTKSTFKVRAIRDYGSGDRATVDAVLWLRGRRANGEVFESHGDYELELVRSAAPGSDAENGVSGSTVSDWTIDSQSFVQGSTVSGVRGGFTEIAAESGLEFLSRNNPMFKTEEWRLERFGIARYASGGVATGDYDGDGWYDVFFGNGGHPQLVRNTGGGHFVDVTASAGIDPTLVGVATALFVDFDNDGDADLFLGRMTGPNLLYRNDGDGHFSDVSANANLGGVLVTGAAAADYDNDGDLDLYISRYLDPRVDLPTTLFYTRNGAGNSLLRNDGGLRFTDVTEEAGVREGGLSLGLGWADLDADGDQDLYVANDFGRNALFSNNGDGTFTDIGSKSDAWDLGYGMSTSIGDVDSDGDLDIYIANVHSGQRWYGQATTLFGYAITSIRQRTMMEDMSLYRELFSLLGTDWRSVGDKVINGNSLLLNDGAGNFRQVSQQANTNPFGWYWGTSMFDYDNDGDLDLYAANGWISGKTYDDL